MSLREELQTPASDPRSVSGGLASPRRAGTRARAPRAPTALACGVLTVALPAEVAPWMPCDMVALGDDEPEESVTVVLADSIKDIEVELELETKAVDTFFK